MRDILWSMDFNIVYYVVVAAVSTLLVLIILPSIVHIAHKNSLFDDRGLFRKEHGRNIPRLGGAAFYAAIILTSLLTGNHQNYWSPVFEFYAASVILFATGVKDDLSGVHCHTKLLVQAVIALIITIPGDVRITNLNGIFHVFKISYWPSVLLSVVLLIFIVNAFNLIDGIDGLAASLGVIACFSFGCHFVLAGQTMLAGLAFSSASALIAFLTYNFSPARIFMGDGGSLFIGLLCAVFAIEFIHLNEASAISLKNAPIIALAALIVPVFDTFHVIFVRLKNKKSPFKPDRNHIHHRLLLIGLSHKQSTLILSGVTIMFICLALWLDQFGNNWSLLIFAVVLTGLNGLVNYITHLKTKSAYKLSVV